MVKKFKWKSLHLLIKEKIIEELDLIDRLTMRITNSKIKDLVDRLDPEGSEFRKRYQQYQKKKDGILYLGYQQDRLVENGMELTLKVLFKGQLFQNYQNYQTELDQFGMVYKWKDNRKSIGFYEGNFAKVDRKTDDGILFHFYFMVHQLSTDIIL
jgi:hypothetical protein